MSASPPAPSLSPSSPSTISSSNSSAPQTSTTTTTTPAVKPCCVCKDEKAARDECMLFSTGSDPAKTECVGMVDRYRDCMRGFGFVI